MKGIVTLTAAFLLLFGSVVDGQIILSDTYTGNGIGFDLNSGVNSGINPPTTRLTGTAAANLRYMLTTSTKTNTAFGISGNKLQVTPAANAGRFTLSADGITFFNFASVLGTGTATQQKPVVYDISIRMANNSPGTQRFSFALGTAEGDATTWDFGVQVFRTAASDNFYTIGKRIDTGSSGLAADLNTFITNSAVGTFGTEIGFLMRVTDAGSETTTFNSRVQVSTDGGFTWIYDTETDPDLPSGWRLNGAGRYLMWDIAPDAGIVTYDNFSVRLMPLSATLVSPVNNSQNFGATATLKAVVSNSIPGNLTVTFFGREAPKPGPGPDFLIPVLPDTQNYARESSGSGNATKEMWFSQTEWIITNRVQKNIAYVATLGDCVQNADSLTEWKNATNAMYRLEVPSRTLLSDGVPYGITVGNHDQYPAGDENGSTAFYNQFFGTAHFQDKAYYGGHYDTNNDSWYDLFSAGGMEFIVFSFEYGRYGSGVLDWANGILATNKNRRCIVLTHHAGDDNSDVNATTTSLSTQGSALYDGLKANTNFFLMLGGHVFNEGGEGRRSDTFNGATVRTLISDYQGRFNGGNGLMRLMYFSPSNNLVSVKTYSPYTDAFETDANSQFSFSYNMQPNGAGSPGTPFVARGTNINVVPGSQSSFVWSGLQANKTYEWYVTVTDEQGNTLISSPQRFTAGANSAPIASNRSLTITGDQPTLLTLPAFDANGDALKFQTNSQPMRGLNSHLDSTNGTILYSPAYGYRGSDQFTFQVNDSAAYSGVASMNITVNAPPDTNSNGLSDAWETQYGISNANADDDNDGQNNLAEYLANTNPTNAASCLRILTASPQTNGQFNLLWSSVGGTRYRIQSSGTSNGAIADTFVDLNRAIVLEMNSSPYGTASTQSYAEPFSLTNKSRFYRIKVVP